MKIDNFHGEYMFLSNFFYAPVEFESVLYPSSEHAYQAAKTTVQQEREAICAMRTAAMAKKAGRNVSLRSDWNEVRDEIMYKIVFDKFTRNTGLKEKLLSTGDAELVEGNWWNDTYWGVCNNGGQNKLGKILMRVRSELR